MNRAKGEHLTTITDAAAEFGLPASTFRLRFHALDIIPSLRIPHSPTGKGFTEEQMEQLRKALGRRKALASA